MRRILRIPCRYARWALALFLALASAADASSAGVDWDEAMIVGSTPGNRICYRAEEEIEFTLRLAGVKGEIPPDTYFVDWSCRGEDGVVEKGRAPLPHPKDGIRVKTKMAVPGCVLVEANVVTADGKRVPKKHRWEPRVFFQGGACVEREAIRGGTEPADYDEFWSSCMDQLSKVPPKAKVEKVVIPDDKADCYSLRIDCAGPRPVTGYMTVPKRVGDRKFPLTVGYCGASHNNLNPPSRGSHDSIHIDITVPGFDLGRDDAYLKEFFKTICLSGNEYGFSPEQLKDRDDCYWKWVILRAVRVLQWATALPEWNGKDLSLSAGSQGAWQALHAAALFYKVTDVTADIAWGCDWTGQAEIANRLRSTYRPKCWFPAMAYFDPVFAARRIKCPVSLVARMGDTCSPPTSLTALYNELRVPKSITYQQGRSHGWSPGGMAVESVSDRCAAPLDMVRAAVSRGEKSVSVPKARYFVAPREGEKTYLKLTGLKDVTIDFNGSELVGLVRARMLALSGCTNVTIRNVTVDYAPLPFTQGRIEKVGKGGEWDVRILGGYPCPTAKAVAQVGNAWPIQAYDGKTLELKNPMRFRDGIKIEKTGLDTYRITGGLDRRGDVGDIAVLSCKEDRMATDTSAVTDNRCVDITWENVTVYSTPHGVGFYDELSEKTVFRNCRLVPRPPETDIDKRELRRLRSGNHDAFMCRGAVVGPQIINCAALYHCDDCVNIGGKYAVVVKKEGRTLRVLADGIGASIGEGHPLQIFAYDGRVLPEATAASVRRVGGRTAEELAFLKGQTLWPSLAESCSIALAVTLDRDMEVPLGSLVISRRHTGDGFVVKGCHFGRNRARGMILQASDGVVEDNFIDHPYDLGMKISMSYLWLEGSCGSNIKVRGNRIEKDGGGTGIYVGGTPGAKGGRIPSDAHRNISFLDNVISGVGCGLDITGCTDVVLDGNDIKVSKGKGPPVILGDVKNVRRKE